MNNSYSYQLRLKFLWVFCIFFLTKASLLVTRLVFCVYFSIFVLYDESCCLYQCRWLPGKTEESSPKWPAIYESTGLPRCSRLPGDRERRLGDRSGRYDQLLLSLLCGLFELKLICRPNSEMPRSWSGAFIVKYCRNNSFSNIRVLFFTWFFSHVYTALKWHARQRILCAFSENSYIFQIMRNFVKLFTTLLQ